MTANTKIIIPVPFPAAPLIVKSESLAFILSVNHVRRISAEYHPSLAFFGIGSTLAPLLANTGKGVHGEES